MWNNGWGFGHHIAGTLGTLAGLFITLVAFSVFAGLIFLLVRFLLVATRAAQIYVAKNETPAAAASAAASAPVAAEPPAPAPAPAPVADQTADVTEKLPQATATKPRTPRAPKAPPAP